MWTANFNAIAEAWTIHLVSVLHSNRKFVLIAVLMSMLNYC